MTMIGQRYYASYTQVPKVSQAFVYYHSLKHAVVTDTKIKSQTVRDIPHEFSQLLM